MHAKVEQINTDKNYIYESFTIAIDKDTTKQQLFKQLMAEYGKPVSKVYIGNTKPIAIGWVFHKRIQYDDCNKTFLQETWVSLEETATTAIPINTLKKNKRTKLQTL